MIDRDGFRLNVGIILTNDEGKLFWGKRIGREDAWQFPQGGVHPYETLEETMFRELYEEVGLTKNDVAIMATNRRWLYYKLPHHLRRRFQKPMCIGQKQKWFLLKLISDESKISFDKGESPEFAGWRWVDYWLPLKQVIYFKREIYYQVLREFEHKVKALKKS